MPLDPSIALQVQQPNPANMISGFLDLGAKDVALRKNRATLAADIEQRKAESRSSQAAATVAEANVNPQIAQQAALTRTSQAQADAAELATMRAYVSNAAQQLEPLRTKPDVTSADLQDSIYNALKASGAPPSAYGQAFQHLPSKNAKPEEIQDYITKLLVRSQEVAAHLNAVAPAPAFLNSGQQAIPVATGNPRITGVPPGTPQGVPVQMQIPPTAQTMGPGGQPQYVGPQPAQQGPVPSGPAIGQVEGTVGPVQIATKHYEQVVADAQPAQTRIAALQTIKQEAPTAMTGGGDWRRNILRQMSGVFGIATDEQTSNDVMAKNLSVLAQQAGNTDAARSLGEIANPNVHMTKEAIEQTANQLIGIEKKKVAAQQAFSGIPTNSPEYTKRMAEWNRAADPRLFEYASLPDDQKAAFLRKLSPGVRAELAMKAKALHDMGVSP